MARQCAVTGEAWWDFSGALWEVSPRDEAKLRMVWSPHGAVIGIVEVTRGVVEVGLGPLVAVA